MPTIKVRATDREDIASTPAVRLRNALAKVKGISNVVIVEESGDSATAEYDWDESEPKFWDTEVLLAQYNLERTDWKIPPG